MWILAAQQRDYCGAGKYCLPVAAAMFVFDTVVGSLSDEYGRRPVLIAALATLAVDYIIMAMAQTYWVLIIGRVIVGMAGVT
tara:strand:+ start:127 stop:372 length:246 start_codon:yes stop_codon:yes gene_type:complete